MEKRERIEFFPLPEAMIHHIQSFMSGKDAAQTTILSKSWYNAWLTRPDLHLHERQFKNPNPYFFLQLAVKTIQRYKRSKLKIHSFTFQLQSDITITPSTDIENLILAAMEIGATHLNLQLSSYTSIPHEVLRSETLIKLSLTDCFIYQTINCPMLKSLTLDRVSLRKDIDVIISENLVSIEEIEISLSNSTSRKWNRMNNPYELPKLKRLYLKNVKIGNLFFDNFDSRFPCLKDLSLVDCSFGYKGINISSASLERISIVLCFKVLRGKFVVPNIASFSYSGWSIPLITVKGASCSLRPWESYISIQNTCAHSSQFYLMLHKLLRRLKSSRINLSLRFYTGFIWSKTGEDEEVLRSFKSKRVVVENVTIEAPAPFGLELLVGLFWICSPKFVTHYWLPRLSYYDWMGNNRSLHNLYHQLLQTANAEDDALSLSTGLGIKEANVQVYEEILTVWHPLVLENPLDALVAPPNKRKVRFGLKWW